MNEFNSRDDFKEITCHLVYVAARLIHIANSVQSV